MKFRLLAALCYCLHITSFATVILQYHHVSDTTPASTSISPSQFALHMQYLADNNFEVIALSSLMNSIKTQTALPNKSVVITFDDAYLDILTQGKPILDQHDYPFTIFINPGIVEQNSEHYLSWQQLKVMADDGVIIANHGMAHDSLIRIPDGMTMQQWLAKNTQSLLSAEKIIAEKTGQSWRYFAYPYGEYNPEIQQWIQDNNFVAFSQQSGAVGLSTNTTIIPRFPASQPYDQLPSLRDKLNALPFSIRVEAENQQTIFQQGESTSVSFKVDVDDFNPEQLNCYISGLGRQEIQWQGDEIFTINYSAALPTGRVRCNCTAPSISEPGRYYWFSKPWFILKENGEWFPL
ncbi:polysaccharide deacetylase family protein [Colwellia sp. MB02u-10]|uniref:polysaccharide deacetylase family protein n=1 Tax=Colwellia sp. MB02u-10 TaxID=2759828 RepID=UPI0015F72D14|nr:polysaccharide deacetylase family protein [Colwellia sp. MB02u-10]MBA6342995.1 polysaccharide deacetylase family protein [Colwellia sp. MB02u-10]